MDGLYVTNLMNKDVIFLNDNSNHNSCEYSKKCISKCSTLLNSKNCYHDCYKKDEKNSAYHCINNQKIPKYYPIKKNIWFYLGISTNKNLYTIKICILVFIVLLILLYIFSFIHIFKK